LNQLIKILITFGSTVSLGFGVWHFFVPHAWKWYSYMNPKATELVAAVRAINVFFSLCLVLFGLMSLFFVYGKPNRYSFLVLLAATCLLWLTRVIMQVVYPQGSINPLLQYGMLAAFILVFLSYGASLWIVIAQRSITW
jgi:hypothetical protein